MKYSVEEIMNIFIRSSRDPRKKANDHRGGRDLQVKNHCIKQIKATSEDLWKFLLAKS